MPIVLVTEHERLSLPIGESTFHYRRVPALKRAEILAKRTTFGLVDEPGYQLDMVQYALLGWDNVTTLDGVPVPYKVELVGALPATVVLTLLPKIQEAAPELVIKNSSEPSSDASPSAA